MTRLDITNGDSIAALCTLAPLYIDAGARQYAARVWVYTSCPPWAWRNTRLELTPPSRSVDAPASLARCSWSDLPSGTLVVAVTCSVATGVTRGSSSSVFWYRMLPMAPPRSDRTSTAADAERTVAEAGGTSCSPAESGAGTMYQLLGARGWQRSNWAR